jgi:hypothetical protein
MLKILLFIILFLLLIYYFNYKTKELFIDNNIKFLTAEETSRFLFKDADKYVNNFSNLDLYARKVKTKNEYLELISTAGLIFNENQKNKLENASVKADIFLNNYSSYVNGKDIARYKWIFGLIGNNYEEGMSHTRGNIIFISQNTINNDLDSLIRILIHEKIHIYQRNNPNEMENIINNMGYKFSRLKFNINKIRANPDLNDKIYKNDKGIEMIGLYKSETPYGISDILITDFSIEHPYEKMAYEISEEYSNGLNSKYKNI